MYPAMTNSLGNLGSIIGSKATTDMALGITVSIFNDIKTTTKNVIDVEVPAAVMHIIFAIMSYLITGPDTQGISLTFLIITAIASNLLSFLIIALFALFSASLAFQRGLNPDNIVIPAITTISDTTATLSISPSIMIAKLII
jgi:mgtE-like transporter